MQSTSDNLLYHSTSVDSSFAWEPSTPALPMQADYFAAPCIAEEQFELVVMDNHKRVELEAARGRSRDVKESDRDFKSNHESAGGTVKTKSIGTDFGITFLKTQVNKKRNMQEECTVTVHDYGKEHYHLNGIPFQKKNSQDQPLPKYTDRIQLAEAIPLITKRRPEWANVRYVFLAKAKFCHRPTLIHQLDLI
jgi:hypothetical protein